MNNFTTYLTGELTLSHFLAGMLFVGLGLLLTLLLNINRCDVEPLGIHVFEYTTTVDNLLESFSLSPNTKYYARGFIETFLGTYCYSAQIIEFTTPAEGSSSFTGNTITAVVENGEKHSNIKRVRAYFHWYYSDPVQGHMEGVDELGSACYANDRFTSTLPDNVAYESLWTSDDFEDGVSFSNRNAKISYFLETIDRYSSASNDDYAGSFAYYKKEAGAEIYGVFVWADETVKITGSYEDEKWDLSLNAGWNLAYFVESASVYEITSKATSDLKWYYEEDIFENLSKGLVKNRKSKRMTVPRNR